MKKLAMVLMILALMAVGAGWAAPTAAQAGELPKIISITTFRMGSLGYTITSAFREAVEKHTPMKLRVEPYGPDVARFKPLQKGVSEFTLATGAQATCASYGMFNFSKKGWGPPADAQRVAGSDHICRRICSRGLGLQEHQGPEGHQISFCSGRGRL